MKQGKQQRKKERKNNVLYRVPLFLRYSCGFGNCVEVKEGKKERKKGEIESEQLKRIDLLEQSKS